MKRGVTTIFNNCILLIYYHEMADTHRMKCHGLYLDHYYKLSLETLFQKH